MFGISCAYLSQIPEGLAKIFPLRTFPLWASISTFNSEKCIVWWNNHSVIILNYHFVSFSVSLIEHVSHCPRFRKICPKSALDLARNLTNMWKNRSSLWIDYSLPDYFFSIPTDPHSENGGLWSHDLHAVQHKLLLSMWGEVQASTLFWWPHLQPECVWMQVPLPAWETPSAPAGPRLCL